MVRSHCWELWGTPHDALMILLPFGNWGQILVIDKFTRRTLGGAITPHKCISFPPEVVCAAVANVNRRFDSPLSDRYRELIMSIQWQHSLNYLTGDGITIPHPNSVQNWVDNMATWPNITYSKICAYFVDSIATDGKAMDSLKASEAYQYLHSDKVGCVMSFKHDRFIYLKANVETTLERDYVRDNARRGVH